MTKKEMIEKVAADTGVSKATAQAMMESYESGLIETVKSDDTYRIVGFGTFSLGVRAERNGVNPATKEKIVIPAKKFVRFKTSSKFLKD